VLGDPHFYPFFKRRFDFMGTCRYKLTGVCDGVTSRNLFGVPRFEVTPSRSLSLLLSPSLSLSKMFGGPRAGCKKVLYLF